MIITNRFVLLNFPKTGTSFARMAIKKIYGKEDLRFNNWIYKTGLFTPEIFELMLPKLDEGLFSGIVDQHGKYRQIPDKFKKRPVLSIVRNPFSWYVSSYFFNWWKENLPVSLDTILPGFPNFPNLTFPEYIDFEYCYSRQHHLHGIVPKVDIGLKSLYFNQFYSKDADALISNLDENYFMDELFREDFKHIHFIHHENLRAELKNFLVNHGFRGYEVGIIDQLEEVNKSTYPNDYKGFMKMYPDELIEKVLIRDRLLFSLFPEYLP